MTGKEPADLLNKQTIFPIKQTEYKNINKYIYIALTDIPH